jgi:alanine or glycine:cation symporter, AGCS family
VTAFSDQFYRIIDLISGFIWGGSWGNEQILPPYASPMVVGLLGTGAFFMVATGFRPLRRLFPAMGDLFSSRGKASGDADGDITPWQALSTALSGQVGTGNLAGVATALALGGPGAIFWMWVTALFGMAAAFAESSLAVRFREKHADGRVHGGPMYYIKNGLGKGWGWLAILFCVGTLFSATATGGMIQANSITQSIVETGGLIGVDIPNWSVGIVIATLVFLVIIGGIKSIGSVAGKVVPFMALFYVICALVVLVLNFDGIPQAFARIFADAWGLGEAAGGVAGYGMAQAIRYGVARGLFSNEAGQGSAPIAHAAAKTNNPVKQGEIAMIGVFIDTIVICTMTALVILVVDGAFPNNGDVVKYAWQSQELEASAITTQAFAAALPYGNWIVTIALFFFAFTTIIGWSYYAEQAITYLFGDGMAKPFRFVWVAIIFVGTLQEVDLVWRLGDLANASMALPNLIAILGLSGVVLAMAKAADQEAKSGLSSKP